MAFFKIRNYEHLRDFLLVQKALPIEFVKITCIGGGQIQMFWQQAPSSPLSSY